MSRIDLSNNFSSQPETDYVEVMRIHDPGDERFPISLRLVSYCDLGDKYPTLLDIWVNQDEAQQIATALILAAQNEAVTT